MALDMLSREEAAEFLKVSKSWLTDRAQKGLPPRFVKMGGAKVFYIKSDLEEFIRSSYVVPRAVGVEPTETAARVRTKRPVKKARAVKSAELTPEELVELYRAGKLKISGS